MGGYHERLLWEVTMRGYHQQPLPKSNPILNWYTSIVKCISGIAVIWCLVVIVQFIKLAYMQHRTLLCTMY